MPKIIIHRKKDWINATKVYEVFLDEQKLGYLSNGDTTEFEVPSGQHKLSVKMGRYGSKNYEYNIYTKDSKSFNVSLNYTLIIIGLVYMIGALFLSMFLMKTHKGEQIYKWSFTAFISLLAIYSQTFGRTTYLILKEEV